METIVIFRTGGCRWSETVRLVDNDIEFEYDENIDGDYTNIKFRCDLELLEKKIKEHKEKINGK
jgi:hypothetical protein